jgi:hypothetical protein
LAVIALSGQLHTNIAITGNVNDTAYSNPGSVAIDAVRVNGLTVKSNVIPLGAQNMALVDVSESCNIEISGNSYAGGVAESRIHPYGGVCPSLSPPAPTTIVSGTNAPAGKAAPAAVMPGSASTSAAGSPATLLRTRVSAPNPQMLSTVRNRGLLIRLHSNHAAAWSLVATVRMTAKLHTTHLRAAHGRLARKWLRVAAGDRSVRLHIPRARLNGLGALVIGVKARASAHGRSVVHSIVLRVRAAAVTRTRKV